MQNLPDTLYNVDSVVRLEQVAINQYDIPAYELMQRAGEAVFNIVKTNYPQTKKILVLCGAGNNAGDGYVVARLSKQYGLDVRVVSLIDPATLKNEALLAYQDWLKVANNEIADFSVIDEADIIVDALLGTGLGRELTAPWAEWITCVNQSSKPVIAIDIPSGLYADTGVIAGVAIKADITVCFIGLKQGMFTAQAKDICGEIVFDDLALPDEVYTAVVPEARLIKGINYALLPKRKAASHKGCFGNVLIAGGNDGMPGAIILAAKAALRAGAGLVTVVTVEQHLEAVSSAVPEAMIKTCDNNTVHDLFNQPFVNEFTHVAIGMGLGQDDWALKLLQHCIQLNKPMLLDADALNLIAQHDIAITSAVVITPHPGEAARLLAKVASKSRNFTSAEVQQDRFSAIKKLHALFEQSESCVVILKGAGTLLFDGETMKLCPRGSAAMAAPGMGDVLSGIVVALMAQSAALENASGSDIAELAVCLHAAAAESLSGGKTRGLLASDVIDELPGVLQ